MLNIDSKGRVTHSDVLLKIFLPIQKSAMPKVEGIIVHQTGGATAESAFNIRTSRSFKKKSY